MMDGIKIREYDAVVIGTGAAGYNAACRIRQDGRKSVCIVTEGINCGTSRNTGSDKQTYYKLGLAGSVPDSVDFAVFRCKNIVLATGGPAGIYADSVYPACHSGSTSLALCAGASLQNMTEWQYGLASTSPRWNVSGTYMQVLPRFVSIDEDGEEREFLGEFFQDKYEALSAVFLKGYQWPFDTKKAYGGSSIIDLLVYRETVLRGRRVYLDYTRNPDALIVQLATLTAMIDYAENMKVSRGSALYYDAQGDLREGLEELFRFSTNGAQDTGSRIQQVSYRDGGCQITWRAVRAMPEDGDFFENVWQRYRADGNIF